MPADADDDVAEERGGSLYQIEVAERGRVEAARVGGETRAVHGDRPGGVDGGADPAGGGRALDGGAAFGAAPEGGGGGGGCGPLSGGVGGRAGAVRSTAVGSASIHMNRPSSAKVTRKFARSSAPTRPPMSTSIVDWISPKSSPSSAWTRTRSMPPSFRFGSIPRRTFGASGMGVSVRTSMPAFLQVASSSASSAGWRKRELSTTMGESPFSWLVTLAR